MIEVLKVELIPDKFRLGIVKVKYHDLVIFLDLCLYKEQNLWVRMPEIWRTREYKMQYIYWDDSVKSEEFQEVVLNKVFDMIGLTLEGAIKLKQNFVAKKKSLTKKMITSKLTKNKKNTQK